MKNELTRVILVALAVGTLAGCASYSARPLDTRLQASSIIEQRELEGLHIAVKDLSSARESARYFDRDLHEHGYAPVMVLLELDASSSAAFDIREDDIHLCLRDGTRLSAADPLEVVDQVSYSHFRSFLGFLLVLPGFFITPSVNNANEQLETDYRLKSIENVRVNPNMRGFRGVAFFAIPPQIQDDFTMEDAFVEFRVYKQKDGAEAGKCLEFPVHFGT